MNIDSSIADLIKTDWANQFESDELNEIQLGLDHGIDPTIYANPELDVRSMELIRQGLENGLNVTYLANPDLDYYHVRDLYEGIENGFDMSPYANDDYYSSQVSVILEGLKKAMTSQYTPIQHSRGNKWIKS